MQVCIPIENDQGLNSPVCAHFGSAPAFLIVDTSSRACRTLHNGNAHHAHGQCAPVAALGGAQVDVVIVGGIGGGALHKLNAAGIQVYVSDKPTVAEALAALAAGSLPLVQPGQTCAGHGHGQAHGHGHRHGNCHGRP